MFEQLKSIQTCELSVNDDKTCIFAHHHGKKVLCKSVIGWWHDLDTELHETCFAKANGRDKLLWRNRQLYGWKKGPGAKKKNHAWAEKQKKEF